MMLIKLNPKDHTCQCFTSQQMTEPSNWDWEKRRNSAAYKY